MTHTELYLIRHGEAVTNVQPIVGGMQGDTGLTERGVYQAESLRNRLQASGEIKADILISSTLPRARQTAEIIAPALGKPIVLDDEVQEVRVGEADGMTIEEMWAKFGSPDFSRNPFRPIAPSAENWAQFMLRIGTALYRITNEHQGKTVVIVCHGGVIDASFVYFCGMSTLELPRIGFYAHNTSLTHWRQRSTTEMPYWRLMSYNDIGHLKWHDLESPDAIRWEKPDDEDGTHQSVPLPGE
jgi:probable phosphoglycerate mutase